MLGSCDGKNFYNEYIASITALKKFGLNDLKVVFLQFFRGGAIFDFLAILAYEPVHQRLHNFP